jgi:hypothetical protein
MRLEAELIEREHLTREDRNVMLELMQRHYDHVVPAAFARDLAEKRWVILIRDPQQRLCGFSTQTLLEGVAGGEPVRILFSGDTIVDRDRWGDPALSHVWGQLALSLIDQLTDVPLYWLLLSQGFRTYRFLPLFFHEFYPRYDAETPAQVRAILASIGRNRYGAHYDFASGVVRSHATQYRLRSGIGELTLERLRDPHIRFFSEQNPGHENGDELCCLAPLTRANFTRAAYRVIGTEVALQVS